VRLNSTVVCNWTKGQTDAVEGRIKGENVGAKRLSKIVRFSSVREVTPPWGWEKGERDCYKREVNFLLFIPGEANLSVEGGKLTNILFLKKGE